jgi:hypothetical protein
MPRLLNIVILLLFAVGKCYTFFRRALFFVSEKSDGKVRTIRRKSLRLFGIPESPKSLFGNTIGHVNAALSRVVKVILGFLHDKGQPLPRAI